MRHVVPSAGGAADAARPEPRDTRAPAASRARALDVPAAVHRLGALQAQRPRAPYVALAARLEGFRRDDLSGALHDRTVVRATLMRETLHLVAAEDYPHDAAAMAPYFRTLRAKYLPEGVTWSASSSWRRMRPRARRAARGDRAASDPRGARAGDRRRPGLAAGPHERADPARARRRAARLRAAEPLRRGRGVARSGRGRGGGRRHAARAPLFRRVRPGEPCRRRRVHRSCRRDARSRARGARAGARAASDDRGRELSTSAAPRARPRTLPLRSGCSASGTTSCSPTPTARACSTTRRAGA